MWMSQLGKAGPWKGTAFSGPLFKDTDKLIGDAVSLLTAKGGQLFLAGPTNRDNSDGTGIIPVSGSNIGYVKSLTSNASATQATSAAKPKLVREPILGPALPVGAIVAVRGAVSDQGNGVLKFTMDGSTDPFVYWPVSTAVSGKKFLVTRVVWTDSGQPTEFRGYTYTSTVQQVQEFGITLTTGRQLHRQEVSFAEGATGTGIVVRCDGQNITPPAGSYFYIQAPEVREILGYKDVWSLEFDGGDDRLSVVTPSGFTAANGSGLLLCCAGAALRVSVDAFIGIANVATGNQIFMLYNNSGFLYGAFRDSLGNVVTPAGPALSLGVTDVLTFWNDAGTLRLRRNGVQVASAAAPTGAISMGGTVAEIAGRGAGSGAIGNVRVQAPVITAGITTLAEVQAIESAVAAAAGVTLA